MYHIPGERRTRRKPAARPDRRTEILDHAERMFAVQGYHGATLSGIAGAAGLGNAGLIHHFPDKARLYRAVLERIAADLDTRLAAALAEAGDAKERLRAFVHVQIAWACERPFACRVVHRELLDNHGRIASARAPLRTFVRTGRGIIAEGQAAGLLAAGPAEIALSLIIGAIAYGAAVRPTFRRMLRAPSLATDRQWLAAVGDGVLDLLVRRGDPAGRAHRAHSRAAPRVRPGAAS